MTKSLTLNAPRRKHHFTSSESQCSPTPLRGESRARWAAARRKAKAAYQDFLALWKDADPDIPLLQQAKAEYARL
jgi:hypothetical protein